MNVVCLQYTSRMGDRWRVGRPNRTDPRTGNLLEDRLPMWRTHNDLCGTCGEMLGTSRGRYGKNRWPATVTATTCVDCGVQTCSFCSSVYRTTEIIGTRRRRTEGGYAYRLPLYADCSRCPSCAKAHQAAYAAQPKQLSVTETILDALGLRVK